jgi:tRNA dimethylallyltransferase
VGGTGLYIRAALEGLIDGGAADEEFRERMEIEHKQALEEGDPLRLHRQLEELDAHAAKRIHPNDLRRTIRALEINQRSGLVASKLQENHSFQDRPYRVLQIALDPGVEALVERIDLRCQEMIDQGLLQEVRQLRKQGVGPELRSMSAIGYRHMAPVVEGTETLTGALLQMQRDTRHFAKRQRTWFRNQFSDWTVIPAGGGATGAIVSLAKSAFRD